MSFVLSQMAILFLILAIGYIAYKCNVLTTDANKMLSKLVLNISLPCTILYSVMNGSVSATNSEALYFTLMVLVSFVLLFLIALPFPLLLRTPKNDRGLIQFLLFFGNVGFMGYPVIQSIFGDGAAFYVTLFNIPFNILLFSVGIIMVSGNHAKFNPKLLLTPTLFTSLAAVIIFAFKLTMPQIIVQTTQLVGHITTPAAMLIIGSTLAAIPIKEVFSEWRIYPLTLVRLIAVPVLTWLVLRLFVSNSLILGVLVVEAGMPTATAAAMLCMAYGGNEKLASKGIFITTLFSIVTIPLVAGLLFT
jgi:predicted permease